MDDDIAREQARLLRRAMGRGDLVLGEVWLHYFSLGGEVGEVEVEAYLHHALILPRFQRDLLAHAVNELIDFAPEVRAPFASDLTDDDGRAADGGDPRP